MTNLKKILHRCPICDRALNGVSSVNLTNDKLVREDETRTCECGYTQCIHTRIPVEPPQNVQLPLDLGIPENRQDDPAR